MAFVLWNAILSGDIFLLSISCFRLKLTGPAFQTTRRNFERLPTPGSNPGLFRFSPFRALLFSWIFGTADQEFGSFSRWLQMVRFYGAEKKHLPTCSLLYFLFAPLPAIWIPEFEAWDLESGIGYSPVPFLPPFPNSPQSDAMHRVSTHSSNDSLSSHSRILAL